MRCERKRKRAGPARLIAGCLLLAIGCDRTANEAVPEAPREGTHAEIASARAEIASARAGGASARAPASGPTDRPVAPPPVNIDDLDHLAPVTFTETETGFRATPREGTPQGDYTFIVPDGASLDGYLNFARVIAGLGWQIDLVNTVSDRDLEAFAAPDRCSIFGSLGGRSGGVLDFGYERRETVDGVILTAFLREDDVPYKKKLPIVLIVGGLDGVVPFEKVSAQYPIYPAQTYLLTLREANHGNYFDGAVFAGDGAPIVSADHQRLMLAEVTANMLDRLCLSRETRKADEARRLLRETQSDAPAESSATP